jgi:hypothetical protein
MHAALPDVDDALLRALSPRTVGERLRLWIGGGWTVVQVLERLDDETRRALGEGDDVVASRLAVGRLRDYLLGLVNRGLVRRKTSRYGIELKSKGQRAVVVDLFRRA